MVIKIPGPFNIFMDKPLKPVFQIFKGFYLSKTAYLLIFYITIGKLYSYIVQASVKSINISIAHSLGQMDRIRPF